MLLETQSGFSTPSLLTNLGSDFALSDAIRDSTQLKKNFKNLKRLIHEKQMKE